MYNSTGSRLGRRSFLKLAAGGVVLGAAGAGGVAHFTRSAPVRRAVRLTDAPIKQWHMVATDGYAAMPDPNLVAPIGVYYPDLLAPEGQNLYVFGFLEATNPAEFALANPVGSPWRDDPPTAPIDFKGRAQISAPLLYCSDGDDLRIKLENLGLAVRPDLFDPHTIHWHGFANQIPYFDGVPDASLSVPSGSELVYRYLPTDVGTYMYHCHVEDVEHVHMGLTGMVFIKPSPSSDRWQTPSGPDPLDPLQKYAYYDASTRYDREFAMILTEANVENHWNDGHIQESDWSEYRSTFGLMNGRSWPDTIKPNGAFFNRETNVWHASQLDGDDIVRLAYQPNSSLIQAEAGETVLLRISNLGFDEHSLVLPGLKMTIVGRDAKFLGEGRADYFPGPQTRNSIEKSTYRIDIGPGESRDILIEVPATAGAGSPDVYPLYDRSILFAKAGDGVDTTALDGYGAMRTELHVYPANALGGKGSQLHPNRLEFPA